MTIGTTIRSWNKRTPSDVRPTGVAKRCASISVCVTMAVEESASANPATSATARLPVIHAAPAPISTAESRTWTEPMPSTRRRIAHSRSSENSSPMRKSRKTTPSSANGATRSGSEKVIHDSHGKSPVSRPRPPGPSASPATMKPGTMPNLRRPNSGTTTPAVASTISNSFSQLPSIIGAFRLRAPRECTPCGASRDSRARRGASRKVVSRTPDLSLAQGTVTDADAPSAAISAVAADAIRA